MTMMLYLFIFFCHFIKFGSGLVQQSPSFPTDSHAMAKQAASAINLAFAEGGIHRQVVRLPLSESMYSKKEEGFVADRAIGWQGGPQETYRYLAPLASDVLKKVAITQNKEQSGGLVARIKEQVLLDFDGTSLMTAESRNFFVAMRDRNTVQ